MKKQHFFFLLLCTTFSLYCLAQENWELKQCIAYALDNNISIKQQNIQAQSDQLTYRHSKLSQYPSINFSSPIGLNTGRSIDATTNQFTTQSIFYNGLSLQSKVEIFNFFRKRNSTAANRYAAEASKESVEKVKVDISINVIGAYLQALLKKQQVEICIVQVLQRASQLLHTRKMVQIGSLPELNAVQLEAQLAQDSADLIIARGSENQAILHLKALLNLDTATPFNILTPPVDLIPAASLSNVQPEAVYQLALINYPQQQINILQLKSAQKSVEAAKRALYPAITLSGNVQSSYSNAKNQAEPIGHSINGYNKIGIVEGTSNSVIAPVQSIQYRYFADRFSNQLSNNFGNGISLGITIPIFNGGAARTNLLQAKLKVKSYELQQQQQNLALKQDIYKAYTEAVTSLQKHDAAGKNQKAAQKAFDFALKRYNMGLLNALDLIATQKLLFSAKLQQLSAHYEYVFTLKVLEHYKGQ